ncbi:PTS transporter subunit IIC [Capnocytophaga canimorsus]|uniref:PTS transporter subunit IIC n=1 Tax=Capnocytophaga canimorsus TaxID=28188 RepID=UPI0037D762A3
MKDFLQRKNIEISLKRYGIEALNAMALGLFASLITGLILRNVGQWLEWDWLKEIGQQAQQAMGAAIGVCVAYALKSPLLVLAASAVVGISAAALGGPVGCFVSVLLATEIGKLVHKTTPIDIVITPVVTVSVGIAIAQFTGVHIAYAMTEVGNFIGWAVELHPFLMGVILSVVMGMLLTLPISSAAIAISLSLSGLAAGAATVGCCTQMIGFAVMSYRENKMAGLLSMGLGTSMLQMPNIIKNPKIWLPPIMVSAVLGPLAILVFKMQNIPSGAGMGTSGLVGQIGTFEAMGDSANVLIAILLLHFALPAILCGGLGYFFRRKGWIKSGDLKISFH